MVSSVSRVICVCRLKDVKVWEIGSRYIVKNIHSQSYRVVVPHDEVDSFIAVTCDGFDVVSEREVLKGLTVADVASMLVHKDRAGWYYQQLLKIAALAEGNPDDVNVVWDADTIPLKRISFVDECGTLVYYTGSEWHKPYFDQIRRTLNLEKSVPFSFIAQCFPAKVRWVVEYIRALESCRGQYWVDAILDSIDGNEVSGFSEYESMGTYFLANFIKEMRFTNNKWERYGNTKIGIDSFSEMIAANLACQWDYIAFESWDTGAEGRVNNYLEACKLCMVQIWRRFFRICETLWRS